MHSQLERQEEDWNVDSLVLPHFDHFQLTRVRLRNKRLLSLLIFSIQRLVLLILASLVFFLLSFLRLRIFIVEDLDVEDDILREGIVEFNIDLCRFVEFSCFIDGVH
jgi:hypothetical protein